MIQAPDHAQLAMPEGGEDRARRVYGALLGLEELDKPEALRGRGGVWFACGTAVLHMGVEAEFRPARTAHPAFRVRDLDARLARLETAGCATRDDEPLPGVRRVFTEDPFGNRLEFLEPV